MPCIRSSLHPHPTQDRCCIEHHLRLSADIAGTRGQFFRVVNYPAKRRWTLTDYTSQVWYRVDCIIRTGTADYLQSSLLINFLFDQDYTSSPGLSPAGQIPHDTPLYPSAAYSHVRCARKVGHKLLPINNCSPLPTQGAPSEPSLHFEQVFQTSPSPASCGPKSMASARRSPGKFFNSSST